MDNFKTIIAKIMESISHREKHNLTNKRTWLISNKEISVDTQKKVSQYIKKNLNQTKISWTNNKELTIIFQK